MTTIMPGGHTLEGELIKDLNLFIRASFVKGRYLISNTYGVPSIVVFSMYETDPYGNATYGNKLQLITSLAKLLVSFADIKEIKFVLAPRERLMIVYPEHKMKGKEDEDLVNVLQNMILPDVFEFLNIEIPGAYIKG